MKRGVNPVQSGNYGGCDERKGWIYGDGPISDAWDVDLRRMLVKWTYGGCNVELRRVEWLQRPAKTLYTVIKETHWVSLKFCKEDGQNLDTKIPKTKKKQQLGVGWVGFLKANA